MLSTFKSWTISNQVIKLGCRVFGLKVSSLIGIAIETYSQNWSIFKIELKPKPRVVPPFEPLKKVQIFKIHKYNFIINQ
jgi:hypothetical protein